MSNKHTPGPWHINDAKGCRWIEADNEDVIARVYKDSTRERFEADSLLIGAAPELLEALQFVMSAHGEQLETAFAQAHTAIAKATGAPNEQ